MDFVKYQALGNDYLVVDPRLTGFEPTPEAVRLLCDRHFGVGADGVLLGPIGPCDPGAVQDPVRLRIFNSDGSECEKSGNGLRMFALYLTEHYRYPARFALRTIAGTAPVGVLDPIAGVVEVGMGKARLTAVDEAFTAGGRELRVTRVDVGNPHAVVPLAEISPELARELGPAIGRHPSLPEGSNVQLVRVLGRGAIEIEIWERGAGYTLASGSSGCAAAAAVRTLGLVGDTVEVRMPGGAIEIRIEDDEITMTGTARPVASGRFAPAFRAALDGC
ncbi:diaminopimelate epimerase [Amycolatopsis minnesotensis]|uniref:Diaminopimelate epimerase n=1 Tax=Amycolatopsis minnesotensis TaxID=337894 RepID=A0ABN2SS44_9PSEU